ncbi:MAG: hypothetical protein U0325_28120 [Polyangiales bacterium]
MTVDASLDFVEPSSPPASPPAVTAAPARPAEPLPQGAVACLDLLLRDPEGFLTGLDVTVGDAPDDARTALARTLLGAVGIAAGVFGAVVGAHRGALQALYCTVKIPLVLLVTLAVCVGPFVAFTRAADLPVRARAVIALALASCARFALVLLGLAPFVWLMEGWALGYHRVILAVVSVSVVAGVFAARLLFDGLARGGAGHPRGPRLRDRVRPRGRADLVDPPALHRSPAHGAHPLRARAGG